MTSRKRNGRILLLALVILVSAVSNAQAARRPRKPADLADATIFSAVSMLNQGGVRPTPQAVAKTASQLLENQQRMLRTAVDSKEISISKYHQRNKQVVAALSKVDTRSQELVRQKRSTVFDRLTRVLEFPFKAAGEIRRFLERPLPDELKPVAGFFLGQYVGRKFDTLAQHLIAKHGSDGDVTRFINAWNKIAPFKDNPALAGTQLRERLQELSRGELGKVFDRLVESGLKRIGANPAAREVFVAQMETTRRAIERGVSDKIDQLVNKHQKELEKLSRDLTRPMPSKEFRRRLSRLPQNLRKWAVQTIADPPVLDEPTTQQAASLKAVFVASPDEGSAPLEVTFYGGDSLGDVSSYAWVFGDTATGGGESTSHVYETEGKFEAVLTITGNDGKSDSTARIIEVKSKPVPKLVVRSVTAQPAEVEPGGSVTLTAEVGVSDCEQEGEVSYTFSPEGLGKVKGGTKADLSYDVECTAALKIDDKAKPGLRKVLVEVAVVLPPPEQAPKGTRPAAMVAKGQGSFTIAPPKSSKTGPVQPLDAWVGTWKETHYDDIRKSYGGGIPDLVRLHVPESMQIRAIGEDKLGVSIRPTHTQEETHTVAGNTASCKKTDYYTTGSGTKKDPTTKWKQDYASTLTFSSDGQSLRWECLITTLCLTDPPPGQKRVERTAPSDGTFTRISDAPPPKPNSPPVGKPGSGK